MTNFVSSSLSTSTVLLENSKNLNYILESNTKEENNKRKDNNSINEEYKRVKCDNINNNLMYVKSIEEWYFIIDKIEKKKKKKQKIKK